MENNKPQISTPVAIIVAGAMIMIAILITRNHTPKDSIPKTLSEQVGVSKETLKACMVDIDSDTLFANIMKSATNATKGVPEGQAGTPYSVVIGPDNIKTEIRGADSIENVRSIIDEVRSGKVAIPYKGEITLSEPNDHSFGNANAPITIIEYSDFECPYCKQFHSTLRQVVEESNGQVRWIYRHWPLHQHSFEKLVASECIAKIKGNDAFWKYTDLLFGTLKTSNDSISEQL